MAFTKFPAEKVVEHILEQIKDESSALLLFVSGGSLLPKLQEVFYRLLDKERDYSHVEIALVDERYAEYSHHADSNYSQLMQLTCVPDLVKQGMKFTPILHEGKNLQETASDYDKYVEVKLAEEGTRKICILGVGADFHTAGILPHAYEKSAQFHTNNVVGYDVSEISDSDNVHRQRITLTFKAIQSMSEVWLYAVGESKAPVINELETRLNSGNKVPDEELAAKPVLIGANLKQNLMLFL